MVERGRGEEEGERERGREREREKSKRGVRGEGEIEEQKRGRRREREKKSKTGNGSRDPNFWLSRKNKEGNQKNVEEGEEASLPSSSHQVLSRRKRAIRKDGLLCSS